MLKVFQGRLLKKAMQTYERSTMVDNGLNPHGLRHVKINCLFIDGPTGSSSISVHLWGRTT